MSKVNFTKLGLNKNTNVEVIIFNENKVEVRQYLPVQDKLNMISEILATAVDVEHPYFYDPGRYDVAFVLQVVQKYTNISFTEKQLEDPAKLYDLIIGSGLWEEIHNVIPSRELVDITRWSNICIERIITHTQSVLGILEIIKNDYNNLDMDTATLEERIANPENLTLLKQLMPIILGGDSGNNTSVGPK